MEVDQIKAKINLKIICNTKQISIQKNLNLLKRHASQTLAIPIIAPITLKIAQFLKLSVLYLKLNNRAKIV